MNPTMNAIDIVVPDLEAAIGFYRRLELDFQPDPHMPTQHAACDLPNGLHLMLDTEELKAKTTADWRPPTMGRTFLAFEFATPADVDTKFAELTAAGSTGLQEPWDAFWGMRYATVTDPGGNGIDLYAGLPTD
jgi:uncharacterized glyoxalase superfamily protein PhnB